MLQQLFDYISKEWGVLSNAPFAFIGLAVVALIAGFGGGMLFYSGQIGSLKEQLNGKDGQIGRYRVALGIDKASQGALIELSAEEMRAKAINTSSRLRDFCFSYRNQSAEIEAQLKASKADEKIRAERSFRLLKELSDEFDKTLRADSFNVDTELRRRLGPKAVASIVGISPSVFSASDGAPVNIIGLATAGGSGISAAFACVLADGIEQMAKMLTLDSKKP